MREEQPVVTVPFQTFARLPAEIRAGESDRAGKMMHQFFGAYRMFLY